jgi:uncharacterized integral membrane protein
MASPRGSEGAGAAADRATVPASGRHQGHKLRRTRVGGVWVGLALTVVVLLLLLVFILENGQQADIGYFGAHGHLPLGVALLLAALAGALLVLIPGSARIMQLRKTARRHHQAGAGLAAADVAPSPDGTGADTPPGPPGDAPA